MPVNFVTTSVEFIAPLKSDFVFLKSCERHLNPTRATYSNCINCLSNRGLNGQKCKFVYTTFTSSGKNYLTDADQVGYEECTIESSVGYFVPDIQDKEYTTKSACNEDFDSDILMYDMGAERCNAIPGSTTVDCEKCEIAEYLSTEGTKSRCSFTQTLHGDGGYKCMAAPFTPTPDHCISVANLQNSIAEMKAQEELCAKQTGQNDLEACVQCQSTVIADKVCTFDLNTRRCTTKSGPIYNCKNECSLLFDSSKLHLENCLNCVQPNPPFAKMSCYYIWTEDDGGHRCSNSLPELSIAAAFLPDDPASVPDCTHKGNGINGSKMSKRKCSLDM
ncbi:unnamed protein product [Orchesella dallaii]|uniref:Uncharacterized protein n=1 Tax=Orchesella dallaii TaxID=48710 RepID=A0ABP1S4G4_9HEXA